MEKYGAPCKSRDEPQMVNKIPNGNDSIDIGASIDQIPQDTVNIFSLVLKTLYTTPQPARLHTNREVVGSELTVSY